MRSDIGNGLSRKFFISSKCSRLGIMLEWGVKIFERWFPKRSTLSLSEMIGWLFESFRGVDCFLTLRMLLVNYHREPSFVLSDWYFPRKVLICVFVFAFLLHWLDCLVCVNRKVDCDVANMNFFLRQKKKPKMKRQNRTLKKYVKYVRDNFDIWTSPPSPMILAVLDVSPSQTETVPPRKKNFFLLLIIG
jgi:hypothetical protein